MTEITNNIFYCGVRDINRKMFDELIPLPQGTSYDSYFVRGSEKTVLIDTAYPHCANDFFREIAEIERLDYVVALHGEQDHSGCLPQVLAKFPEALVLTNATCKKLLIDALPIDEEKIRVVADNEEIPLGGKTLRFLHAPWVHWGDTMFAYIPEDGVIFTTDFLGAHTSHFDVFSHEDTETLKLAKRYYAAIMMPFRSFCVKHLRRIRELAPKWIMPAHGGVYRNPDFILKAYEEWTSDACPRKVLIPMVSAYGNTAKMAEYLAEALRQRGFEAIVADAGDLGTLSENLADAHTIVFAASMMLAGPHPAIANVAYLANLLKPKAKCFAVIGSYGWGGKLAERLAALLTQIKPEFLGEVLAKGAPTTETFAALDALADKIHGN